MCRGILILLVLLWAAPHAAAAVACDGLDDDLLSGLNMANFMTGDTGTMTLWFQPTGVSENNGTGDCWTGGLVLTAYESGAGNWFGITRHSDYQGLGLDRITGFSYDGAFNCTATAYTPNVWTHLAWVHGGGVLSLYKDGTLVESTPSGTVASLVGFLHVCVGTAFTQLEIEVAEGVVSGVEIFPIELTPTEIRLKAQARLHRFGRSPGSGTWTLDGCSTTGGGVSFYDESGNGRPLLGDNGPNTTGLTCLGNTVQTYPWGVE